MEFKETLQISQSIGDWGRKIALSKSYRLCHFSIVFGAETEEGGSRNFASEVEGLFC